MDNLKLYLQEQVFSSNQGASNLCYRQTSTDPSGLGAAAAAGAAGAGEAGEATTRIAPLPPTARFKEDLIEVYHEYVGHHHPPAASAAATSTTTTTTTANPPAHRPTGPPTHRPTDPPTHRPTDPPARRPWPHTHQPLLVDLSL